MVKEREHFLASEPQSKQANDGFKRVAPPGEECGWLKWWISFFFTAFQSIIPPPSQSAGVLLYMWLLDVWRDTGALEEQSFSRGGRCWGNNMADGWMKCSWVGARSGGASSVSGEGRWCSVSAAILNTSLMLQVVIAVLTNPHRWRDLQPFDLWLEPTAPGKQKKKNH